MRWIIALLLFPTLFFASSFQNSPSDRFQFGILWNQIKPLDLEDSLQDLIQQRRTEIKKQKEFWRPFTQTIFENNQEFFLDFSLAIQKGSVSLSQEGSGSAYLVYDALYQPCFVVKPTDEDIFCLHNSKHFGSPLIEPQNRARKDIPLYLTAQTEALCYEIAKLAQLEHILPKTLLSLISLPQFFDISDRFECADKSPIDREKLCSVQKYLSETLSLKDLLNHLFLNDFDDEKIQKSFDQENFAEANLFVWLTYDNDAHPSNFRACLKKISAEGHPIYGLQKIDNGLSFPLQNSGFFNALMYFPNAKEELSSKIRFLIKNLPLEEMKKAIEQLGLSPSINAFEERIYLLTELAEKENITYYECNLRLILLEKKKLLRTLHEMSIEELESLAIEEISKFIPLDF